MLVRVKGIKEYEDRHGQRRRYHRKSGTAIDMKLKGAALAAEVDRLDKLHKAKEAAPGTLRAVTIDYKTRAEHWTTLRDRTRKDYERVWAGLGSVMDLPITDFTPVDIANLRDKAREKHEYKFANQVLTTLKAVFVHALENGYVETNPVSGVKRAQKPKAAFNAETDEDEDAANRPWSQAERDYVLGNAPAHLRYPVAIALYTGARQGDILKMSKKAYEGGWLKYRASKTRKWMEVPVSVDLAAILDAMPKHEATTLLVNSRGAPWGKDGSGFRASWGKWKDEAEKLGHIKPDLTFHGTRHTVATELKDSGWEDEDIGVQLGQDSPAMPKHYSRRAKQVEKKLLLAESVQKANKSV